ncbi:uncharacterized protein L969DRAFT_47695 [Mixia osmundae IAM 14324]|uniref:2'-phosphotransferase n=1 Tax=Mixia osmundae (strain CBS 9802 / IAM 14324 / JCM 22182 / KY 12970) TaxID=764103 RepID=G7E8V7_MIXOS|nr:uncharacterized protein L969DRAFT_47695 [Mixia osmundae IAM 14324]KEI40210.1 hypothetical protein L969DRAFT_47695 [Mixia osmundae IAM 14324]GAA99575.1 hypothetical protein E5Q_06276 [Mixia osmundae IAM 14324]
MSARTSASSFASSSAGETPRAASTALVINAQSGTSSIAQPHAASPLKPGRRDTLEVQQSKALSYILRHGASKEQLKLRPDGFIKVDDLLRRPKLKGLTVEGLHGIVANDAKRRYTLASEVDQLTGGPCEWIRANQGHSLPVDFLELIPIATAEELPVAVHGTYLPLWEVIRVQGLKTMSRTHIHLARGPPGSPDVTSGIRPNCNVYIYVDAKAAMADGIEFFSSANDVILTRGQNGVLSPRYFQKVSKPDGTLLA